MNELERQLYWEMVRTIRILGGQDDLLKVMEIVDSQMPESESLNEICNLLSCWNTSAEDQLGEIPVNPIYEKLVISCS